MDEPEDEQWKGADAQRGGPSAADHQCLSAAGEEGSECGTRIRVAAGGFVAATAVRVAVAVVVVASAQKE